jgi:glucosamine--fructose-6-phosphate aminotransferase (isomerizing)
MPETARGVLSGYRNRYAALRSAVTETEPTFDDALLGEVSIADLLTVPVYTLADRWRER